MGCPAVPQRPALRFPYRPIDELCRVLLARGHEIDPIDLRPPEIKWRTSLYSVSYLPSSFRLAMANREYLGPGNTVAPCSPKRREALRLRPQVFIYQSIPRVWVLSDWHAGPGRPEAKSAFGPNVK